MKVIGVTGGIGAGKTVVLSLLKQHFNAEVILADVVAHELMKPGGKSYTGIVNEFGARILDHNRVIDKKILSEIIFRDAEKRSRLNQLVHPLVKKEIIRRIAESKQELVVVEAALLIEDHYDEICDELWYIHASKEKRITRLIEDRGYSEAKCHSIMDSQLSEEEYRKHCNRVIDNDGSIEDVLKELKILLEK